MKIEEIIIPNSDKYEKSGFQDPWIRNVEEIYQRWVEHFFNEPNGRKRGLADAKRRALSALLRDLDALMIPKAEVGSSAYQDMEEKCCKVVEFLVENHSNDMDDWLNREMVDLERMMSSFDPRVGLIMEMTGEQLTIKK